MHIGLFDSGVGGLTVLRELKRQIPQARYTYLGDTARLPYGNKAPETLKKYTAENIKFLDGQDVDVIIIACHSASSVSLDLTQSGKGTPIFNVIAPSCQQAVQASKRKAIGVMATQATIRSNVYAQYISGLGEKLQVTSQQCPLLVPLVEEGMIDDEITVMALNRYLAPLLAAGIDTLLLGCTHYPILKEPIAEICGPEVQLIDPALSVAEKIKSLGPKSSMDQALRVFLTDHAPHFIAHGKSLLGELKDTVIRYPEDLITQP